MTKRRTTSIGDKPLFTPLMDEAYRVLQPHAKPDEGGILIVEKPRYLLSQRLPNQCDQAMELLRRNRTPVLEQLHRPRGNNLALYKFHEMDYQVVDRLPGRPKSPALESPFTPRKGKKTSGATPTSAAPSEQRNGHVHVNGNGNGHMPKLGSLILVKPRWKRPPLPKVTKVPNQLREDVEFFRMYPKFAVLLLELQDVTPGVLKDFMNEAIERLDRIQKGKCEFILLGGRPIFRRKST
jgi:hypothetical protein